MSVIQLTDKNFYLAGHRNKTLNVSIEEDLLVLFKMENCPACAQFKPIFFQLAKSDKRIRYAICDVSQHNNVPRLSQMTAYPIKAVPWIFFYSGGFPVARFKGNRNAPSVQAFVGKALQEVQNRQRRSQRSFVPQHQQMGASQYPVKHQGQPHSQQPKYWKPEMGKTPSMQGIVRDGTQYSYMGDVEEDNDKAEIPDVIPHNTPWISKYKGLLD